MAPTHTTWAWRVAATLWAVILGGAAARECKMSDFGTKYRWDKTGKTYCICACAD